MAGNFVRLKTADMQLNTPGNNYLAPNDKRRSWCEYEEDVTPNIV